MPGAFPRCVLRHGGDFERTNHKGPYKKGGGPRKGWGRPQRFGPARAVVRSPSMLGSVTASTSRAPKETLVLSKASLSPKITVRLSPTASA